MLIQIKILLSKKEQRNSMFTKAQAQAHTLKIALLTEQGFITKK